MSLTHASSAIASTRPLPLPLQRRMKTEETRNEKILNKTWQDCFKEDIRSVTCNTMMLRLRDRESRLVAKPTHV